MSNSSLRCDRGAPHAQSSTRILAQKGVCVSSAISVSAKEKRTGAPADTGNRLRSNLYSFWHLVRRLYRDSTLYVALHELRNLSRRIRWVADIRAAERLRGSATVHRWLNEALIPPPESRQSACIHYIRRTRELHPFLSIFDTHLITKGWIAGSEWSAHNTGTSRSPENPETSTS